MNYLAHLYLSGTNEKLRLGNFMGDAIKGNAYKTYPEQIQKGVLLHRAIDSYTDTHSTYKKHVRWFFPEHRHYSRVIVDVLYDHLLAIDWKKYHSQPLEKYINAFYSNASTQRHLMPVLMQRRFDAMKKYNWLLAYADLASLETILKQMSQRTQFPSQMHLSVSQLEQKYDLFRKDFFVFFSDIRQFTQEKLHNL